MILESNFEKEFSKHLSYCRDEFYENVRNDVNVALKSGIKINNLNIQKAIIAEALFKDTYEKFAINVKRLIIEKFKTHKIEQRLNSINSFFSEMWKIGFSWKNDIEEIIIFFTFDQNDNILYQCNKLDYSYFIKEKYSTPLSKIEKPFPDWFVNSLKLN
jgi:hypothetical protein